MPLVRFFFKAEDRSGRKNIGYTRYQRLTYFLKVVLVETGDSGSGDKDENVINIRILLLLST